MSATVKLRCAFAFVIGLVVATCDAFGAARREFVYEWRHSFDAVRDWGRS